MVTRVLELWHPMYELCTFSCGIRWYIIMKQTPWNSEFSHITGVPQLFHKVPFFRRSCRWSYVSKRFGPQGSAGQLGRMRWPPPSPPKQPSATRNRAKRPMWLRCSARRHDTDPQNRFAMVDVGNETTSLGPDTMVVFNMNGGWDHKEWNSNTMILGIDFGIFCGGCLRLWAFISCGWWKTDLGCICFFQILRKGFKMRRWFPWLDWSQQRMGLFQPLI